MNVMGLSRFEKEIEFEESLSRLVLVAHKAVFWLVIMEHNIICIMLLLYSCLIFSWNVPL